jgi:hypothetical protein
MDIKNKPETLKLKDLAENISNEDLVFLQYSSHWLFRGHKYVVKVAKLDLKNEINIVKYLVSKKFPALNIVKNYQQDGYYFYLYPLANVDIPKTQVITFIADSLPKLHGLEKSDDIFIPSYKEEVSKNLTIWSYGFHSLPTKVQIRITDVLEKAFDLSASTINHGDPLMGNVVELSNQLYFIDWEHVCMAPNELDLAIIKYRELLGEPKDIFDTVLTKFRSINYDNLEILINSREAYAIVWYADRLYNRYFTDKKKLDSMIESFVNKNSKISKSVT